MQLPDVECDNCTLQAIQVMYDKPPYVTPGNDLYYQCADLVLRRGVAATPVPTPTVVPTCAAPCANRCVGDCNGDGEVNVNELILAVRIAMGVSDLASCPAGDAQPDGVIRVDDVVAAVHRSLEGCPVGG